jgi:hypothetical protein
MRYAYVRAMRFPEFIDSSRARNTYSPEVYRKLRTSWDNFQAIPWGLGAAERVPIALQKVNTFIGHGGAPQLLAGTDAGSPLNLHSSLTRELRNLHEAGLSTMEAIQSATLRPAQAQGMLDKVGTLSAGKLADVLVVDGDPLTDLSVLEHRVALVIKDGALYRPEPLQLTITP